MSNRQTGIKGENIAAKYLQKHGYKILDRNYRTKSGEIDIIAKHIDTIVFIEVKLRTNNKFGSPKSSVNLKKQQKISKTAMHYLQKTNQNNIKARFDVASIYYINNEPIVEIIKNAFESAF